MIFNQQQMSPTFLYLGNPEELRDGVGDIFALKIMQNPNIETVFKSEQICKNGFDIRVLQHFESKNVPHTIFQLLRVTEIQECRWHLLLIKNQ